MFQINDVIIYGTQGVCRIADMEEKAVGGVRKKYFVLKPLCDNSATIFAPTDNAQVLKKMRRLLSEAEINRLIDSMPTEDTDWNSNQNERREQYKKVITGGDHLELIKMIKSIYAHKQMREAEGKRLHVADERFFKEAEQILYNEFQYVLNLRGRDDLMDYILARISKQDA